MTKTIVVKSDDVENFLRDSEKNRWTVLKCEPLKDKSEGYTITIDASKPKRKRQVSVQADVSLDALDAERTRLEKHNEQLWDAGTDAEPEALPDVYVAPAAGRSPIETATTTNSYVAGQVVEWICEGATTPEQAGRRLLVYRHVLHRVPETQRELASILGVSEAAVSKAVKAVRQELRQNANKTAPN